MKFIVNSSSGVPIYRQLVQQIEKGIVGEILKPGDQLPTVREVALNLTVNPNTVARAYRELEHRGLIESIQGRGTYIAANLDQPEREDKERIIIAHLKGLIDEARQLNLEPADLEKLFIMALKRWKEEE